MRKDIKYKAILFDLFGTLVHHCPQEDFKILMTQMSAEMNIDTETFTQEWIKTSAKRATGELNIKNNIKLIAKNLNKQISKNSYNNILNIRKKFFKMRLTPRKETIKTLEYIKNKGYKLALISDCGSDIPAIFAQTTMHNFFDSLIFSCDAKVKKPDKNIYIQALNTLNISPKEALFIGDGGSDELTGAKNVGIDAIKLNDPLTQKSFRYQANDHWDGTNIDNLEQINNLI